MPDDDNDTKRAGMDRWSMARTRDSSYFDKFWVKDGFVRCFKLRKPFCKVLGHISKVLRTSWAKLLLFQIEFLAPKPRKHGRTNAQSAAALRSHAAVRQTAAALFKIPRPYLISGDILWTISRTHFWLRSKARPHFWRKHGRRNGSIWKEIKIWSFS